MEQTRDKSKGPKVVVFGADHSPWTQAVLFKLAEEGYRDADVTTVTA